MSRTAARLAELGIELPAPAAPAANYVPWVRTGNLVVVSGQIPMEGGEVRYRGVVGADLDLETGRAAARLCGLNLLAQVREACGGDLDRVVRCVRLGGFVQSADGFTQQPAVINGASDLMVEVLGDRGRHARAAVGTNALPLGVAVEVEGMFEIRDAS
jgi:enamine deaminase RidA (YjgF/YER057c/UK114 family)